MNLKTFRTQTSSIMPARSIKVHGAFVGVVSVIDWGHWELGLSGSGIQYKISSSEKMDFGWLSKGDVVVVGRDKTSVLKLDPIGNTWSRDERVVEEGVHRGVYQFVDCDDESFTILRGGAIYSFKKSGSEWVVMWKRDVGKATCVTALGKWGQKFAVGYGDGKVRYFDFNQSDACQSVITLGRDDSFPVCEIVEVLRNDHAFVVCARAHGVQPIAILKFERSSFGRTPSFIWCNTRSMAEIGSFVHSQSRDTGDTGDECLLEWIDEGGCKRIVIALKGEDQLIGIRALESLEIIDDFNYYAAASDGTDIFFEVDGELVRKSATIEDG